MNGTSLRTKFVLILVLGAVLPLGIVGWWLTGTAARSGRTLLRGQLEAAIDDIAIDAGAKWTQRSGDLQLLANNSAVRAGLISPDVQLAMPDSTYLLQLYTLVHESIPFVTFMDNSGKQRWAFSEAPGSPILDTVSESRLSKFPARTLPIDIPVLSDSGARLGTLRARLRLSSVLSATPEQNPVPGAKLEVRDAHGIVFSSIPDSVNLSTPQVQPGWEVVSRSLDTPPLHLVIAAATAPFVKPFERAARIGLSVLFVVALVALFLTANLTGRVTGSIERMVVAAEKVAAGDLTGHVTVDGHDEISRLGGAFNAMTESLRRTLAELSQQRALAAVGEFAASLSHEVRNSLTAIRIDLQHAVRQLPPEATATPLVTRTLDTVRRLDSTVTGALKVARSGQATMRPVDLGVLLRRAMASAEPSFELSEATLEALVMESGSVEVDGDAGALEQLFLNLLLNAAQALDAGGSTLVEVSTEANRVIVRISDNGHGVAAGALIDVGTVMHSTKPDGTGLGLPIASRIAAAHGGDLKIESVVGDGTTVVVTLPRRQVESVTSSPA